MMAAGGEVWFGDETTVREFPPLRACWAKRGEQRVVVISGRNRRRVIHGALDAANGGFIWLIRERSRQDDCLAFAETLGQVHPDVPKLLVWDNAPPHHPKRVASAAAAAHIQIAWLPFRSPELMPCEDLWRLAKAQVAANRPYRHELGWADEQMRPERAIVRHWQLVLLAYTFSLLVGALPQGEETEQEPPAPTASDPVDPDAPVSV